MTTTIKCQTFLEGPCGDKLVGELPGIGSVYANNLKGLNIIHAYQLVGYYLFCQKNDDVLDSFLKDKAKMQTNHIVIARNAIKQWVNQYV